MRGFDREEYFLKLLKQSGITQALGDDCAILGGVNSSHLAHISHAPRRINTAQIRHFKPSAFTPSHAEALKASLWNPRSPYYARQDSRAGGKGALVFGMDSFCEGVHFLREWFTPSELAYKAFVINLSDIIAMNATPLYGLLSLALPREWGRSEIRELVGGIARFAKEWGIRLIGGDTISAPSLQLHITMIARAHRHTLYRDRLPRGVRLFATSARYPRESITRCSRVLDSLLRAAKRGKLKDSKNLKGLKKAQGRFLNPTLRAAFVRECAPFLSGGMDISDGLGAEIRRLCALNHCSFAPALSYKCHRALFLSGEEYEMLLAAKPRFSLALSRRAAKYRIRLIHLGKLTRRPHRLPPRRLWH